MRSRALLPAAFAAALLASCQNAPPVAYVEQIVVQGFLFANRPIDSIVVRRSMPVNEYYDPDSAGIPNAQVTITVDGAAHTLVPYAQPPGYYYLPDTSLLVRSGKTYYLRIVADGQTVAAQTTVPDSITITQPLPDTVQYPHDTMNVLNVTPPSITWTAAVNKASYAASIVCEDTLWYDSALHLPNRRVKGAGHESNGGGQHYNDIERWGIMIPFSSIPIPWNSYKWYGRQKITVYAADKNFSDWLKMIFFNGGNFNQELSHINGGVGVFGSAGIDTTTTFLKTP